MFTRYHSIYYGISLSEKIEQLICIVRSAYKVDPKLPEISGIFCHQRAQNIGKIYISSEKERLPLQMLLFILLLYGKKMEVNG